MAELAGSAASLADFIRKNAEDLWGDFRHTDFGRIILWQDHPAIHAASLPGMRP